MRDAVLDQRVRAAPRRRARPPRSRPSPARRSTSSSSPSLSSAEGLAELLERGLVREERAGAAAFRHALTREALYADVPWMRRRALHRALAEALEAAGAPSREIAAHWLGARDGARAREALLRAAAESEAVHAYRDAADGGPPGARAVARGRRRRRAAARRSSATRAARELAGELAEAARAWRELGALRGAAGDERALARRAARARGGARAAGDREAAFAARRLAAEAFAANGRPAEAAVEQLAMANQRRLAARHGEAIELARRGARGGRARRAASTCASARSGSRAWRAPSTATTSAGSRRCAAALALALEHDLTAVAAELYQRLSVTLYDSADFRRAEEALDTALAALPREPATPASEVACVTCMAYVLRERGEWPRAADDEPRADRRAAPPCSSPRACSARSTPSRASSARRAGC